jgi:hypothetical protein
MLPWITLFARVSLGKASIMLTKGAISKKEEIIWSCDVYFASH